MSRRLHATFAEVEEVAAAVERLRAARFDDAALEVRSQFPLPIPNLPGMRKSRVLLAALIGGLLGGSAAFGVASLTVVAYPLHTGGMPLMSGPPLAIITYEGTALGLILATVGMVVYEARLWPRKKGRSGPLDVHLVEGLHLVAVDCADEDREQEAREALEGSIELAAEEPAEAGETDATHPKA